LLYQECLSGAEKKALIGLMSIPGIGPGIGRRLLGAFDSAQAIFEAPKERLLEVSGVGESMAQRLLRGPEQRTVEDTLDRIEKHQIRILYYKRRDYPQGLLRLASPPLLMYLKGNLPEDWSPHRMIGIVGTRNPDRAGTHLTAETVRTFCQKGWTVVSGGALGIDASAHYATLHQGGVTIAVLGCGVDQVYPSQHRELFERICAQGGALLSEFPPGTLPERGFFPRRNRLIAALCSGVLVVQGRRGSGALNTAEHAQRLDVPVMAFPGRPGDPLSEGPHQLIRDGARLVESGEEIIEYLQGLSGVEVQESSVEKPGSQQTQLSLWGSPTQENRESIPEIHESGEGDRFVGAQMGSSAKRILELLSKQPQHIDEIVQKSSLATAQVTATLLELELEGWVTAHPGMLYSRQRSGSFME